MLRSVDLKDYIQLNPVTVRSAASLQEAVQLIVEHKVSGLCVVDQDNNLLGILSEMDCLRGILAATYNEGHLNNVSEYMTTNVDTAHLDENIVSVASDMMSKQQRRRPVVDNGKLIGQITCRQLLRAIEEFPQSCNKVA